MAKSQNNSSAGEIRTPALRATEGSLRVGSDQSAQIQADISQCAAKPSGLEALSLALKGSRSNAAPPTTCKQIVWFSFFFDGTGNNLDADAGMLKHSNVAKLFRVHAPPDKVRGIYSFYIPGVGTYFPAIGDDGGSALGLGCGAMGQKRLDYALGRFDQFLASHLSRDKASTHAIVEINVSAFGFSRGAALARAFVNLLLNDRCELRAGKWVLKSGTRPVRIRFMGLFDTVASVGLPMSTNTTSTAGAAASSVSYMIGSRLRDYRATRPEMLAFSTDALPGADPAPGIYDGHKDWGSMLEIHEAVEEVRHFVAAHEIRNSFPLDSVSVFRSGQIWKPGHFHETVYPGVHSDVGGSYAPGEGARSELPAEKLGLIPLLHMYQYAMRRGVPLLPIDAWAQERKEDFDVAPNLFLDYNQYLKKIGSSASLGAAINKNMEFYFAWRFRAIRRKMSGDGAEAARVSLRKDKFKQQDVAIESQIAHLSQEEQAAERQLKSVLDRKAAQASSSRWIPGMPSADSGLDQDIQLARQRHRDARDALLKAKARKFANPNMEKFEAMLEAYDKQLLLDVRAVREAASRQGFFTTDAGSGRRRELRPHYKILLEAYENEFERNKGLADEAIIRFFDNYVHDSLAAFAMDATLPSDPRVVYLGGDEKYRYADQQDSDDGLAHHARMA